MFLGTLEGSSSLGEGDLSPVSIVTAHGVSACQPKVQNTLCWRRVAAGRVSSLSKAVEAFRKNPIRIPLQAGGEGTLLCSS